jgi:hypothetical protein
MGEPERDRGIHLCGTGRWSRCSKKSGAKGIEGTEGDGGDGERCSYLTGGLGSRVGMREERVGNNLIRSLGAGSFQVIVIESGRPAEEGKEAITSFIRRWPRHGS